VRCGGELLEVRERRPLLSEKRLYAEEERKKTSRKISKRRSRKKENTRRTGRRKEEGPVRLGLKAIPETSTAWSICMIIALPLQGEE
jgi:hypothetical protein